MKSSFVVAAIVATAALPSQAATVIEQSVIAESCTCSPMPPAYIQKFDGDLNTLIGIQIGLVQEQWWSGTVSNPNPDGPVPYGNFDYTMTSSAGVVLDGVSYLVPTLGNATAALSGSPYPFKAYGDGTFDVVDWSPFIGAGVIAIGFRANEGSLNLPVDEFVFQRTDTYLKSSLTITYLTSSIPEPATWLMMIAGFGLVGGAMRRRAVTAPAG